MALRDALSAAGSGSRERLLLEILRREQANEMGKNFTGLAQHGIDAFGKYNSELLAKQQRETEAKESARRFDANLGVEKDRVGILKGDADLRRQRFDAEDRDRKMKAALARMGIMASGAFEGADGGAQPPGAPPGAAMMNPEQPAPSGGAAAAEDATRALVDDMDPLRKVRGVMSEPDVSGALGGGASSLDAGSLTGMADFDPKAHERADPRSDPTHEGPSDPLRPLQQAGIGDAERSALDQMGQFDPKEQDRTDPRDLAARSAETAQVMGDPEEEGPQVSIHKLEEPQASGQPAEQPMPGNPRVYVKGQLMESPFQRESPEFQRGWTGVIADPDMPAALQNPELFRGMIGSERQRRALAARPDPRVSAAEVKANADRYKADRDLEGRKAAADATVRASKNRSAGRGGGALSFEQRERLLRIKEMFADRRMAIRAQLQAAGIEARDLRDADNVLSRLEATRIRAATSRASIFDQKKAARLEGEVKSIFGGIASRGGAEVVNKIMPDVQAMLSTNIEPDDAGGGQSATPARDYYATLTPQQQLQVDKVAGPLVDDQGMDEENAIEWAIATLGF